MMAVAVGETLLLMAVAVLMVVREWDWRFCWAATALGCGAFVFLAVLNGAEGEAVEAARWAGMASVCALASVATILRRLM
jgi:hypothetical protein